MAFTDYTPIFVAIVAFIVLYYLMSRREGFSKSGLAISDPLCLQLADVYYKPSDGNPETRDDYRRRICGKVRRNTVDFGTGNYFTEDGELV